MSGKRLFDIAFSVGAILFFLPFGLIIALLIKLSSKGPILYACTRIGLGGKPIQCWKFRTMCLDAETKLATVLASDEKLKGEWEQYQKLSQDPRINTEIGRFLRKTSLDELPQFWNVLTGEMSLVGARPPTPAEVEHYSPHHFERLRMKPGLTGLWQLYGNNAVNDFEDIVKLDCRYIDNWSLWLDVKILIRTIPKILRGGGC